MRRNPMVLVKMIDPHTAMEHLRRMIRDCLDIGLSADDTRDHAARELLRSATRNEQPHDTCYGAGSKKTQEAPS